jgi:transglutaminase-like putative cysteine protease
VLHETLRYDYPSPIRGLRHHLMVLPPLRHGGQLRTRSSLEVKGARAQVSELTDRFGNVAIQVRAANVRRGVEFVVEAVVEHRDGPVALLAPESCTRLLEPSPLTMPDNALATVARSLLDSGTTGLALARLVNAWVSRTMRYRHDVTSVRTTAGEALALGEGVCQDYAHLMIALCRLCRLPARYVSGHLLGEGGSHAWVEVLVPPCHDPSSLVAVAFDPTNDREGGPGYLTVAVGRDYTDVAPTHGTYSGQPGGRLTMRKSLLEETVALVSA